VTNLLGRHIVLQRQTSFADKCRQNSVLKISNTLVTSFEMTGEQNDRHIESGQMKYCLVVKHVVMVMHVESNCSKRVVVKAICDKCRSVAISSLTVD